MKGEGSHLRQPGTLTHQPGVPHGHPPSGLHEGTGFSIIPESSGTLVRLRCASGSTQEDLISAGVRERQHGCGSHKAPQRSRC